MMWIGIDGGGSTVRIVLVDDGMNEHASYFGPAVNPSSVGYDIAAERIRAGIQDILCSADTDMVTGVGIGVAGASADHSADWLIEVVEAVLPDVFIVPSSDEEIALVGGRGRLDGLVLLAGTGSIAFGRHADGRRMRAGGWGYLLGDEGSGYWIGLQAARMVTLDADSRLLVSTRLPRAVMETIDIDRHNAIIRWAYHEAKPGDVAALASVVLELADAGDEGAQRILDEAAAHLAALVLHVGRLLDMPEDTITYAGGLLTSDNALSRRVTSTLGLRIAPTRQHSPVIGAALLAKLNHEENR
ncbi:MAG: N-acetylglucosamine kinase [Chloroflexota bacterium]